MGTYAVRCGECGAECSHANVDEPEFVDCVNCGRASQEITRIDADHYDPSHVQP